MTEETEYECASVTLSRLKEKAIPSDHQEKHLPIKKLINTPLCTTLRRQTTRDNVVPYCNSLNNRKQ